MTSTFSAIDNGPLKLDAQSATLTQAGEDIPYGKPAMLCRCGQSANKPFCDGSHRKIEFKTHRESTEEGIQDYPGQNVRIQFNRSICSGAARCVKSLPEVFRSDSSDDWIRPDAAGADKIRAVVDACPSGALTLYEHDALVPPVRRGEPTIEIIKDGPYLVEGIEFSDADWHTHANTEQYALCRCGLSKNKPFCDYSHAEQGWKETEQ